MYSEVDDYFENTTPWGDVAAQIRAVMLDCGLGEAIKWGKPCFTHDGKNIAIIQEMKDFVALLFFRGVLLDDPDGLLEAPGENSNSGRRACFTSIEQVIELEPSLRGFVKAGIALAKAGATVPERGDLVLVDELQKQLEGNPEFKAAFEALTPGRQRGYNLHFSGAKQSATRTARVKRAIPAIMDGKGMHDR